MLSISNDIEHIVVFFSFVSGITKWCHPKMVTPGAGRPPPRDATGLAYLLIQAGTKLGRL